jgi:archaellum component FlaF (FlaF/FlaG flagellin family)
MVLIPATVVQAASSTSEASEVYVAMDPSSSPELDVIDSTTGAVIGSPIPLAEEATALADYTRFRSAVSEVLAVEDDEIQEVDPATDAVSTGVSLAAAPNGVVVADQSPTQHYALVLEPSTDKVQVVDLDTSPISVVQSVSLGFSSGDPTAIAMNNVSNSNAYVTDATSHQVVTLEYDSTSTPFEVESTYTGSSSFDPGSIVFDQAYDEALVSTGADVELSDVSSGAYSAPTTDIDVACGTGLQAGDLTLNDSSGANAYVQEPSSDYTGDISLSADDLAACMASSFTAGPVALADDGGVLAEAGATASSLDLFDTQAASVGYIENTVSLPGPATAIAEAGRSCLLRDRPWCP